VKGGPLASGPLSLSLTADWEEGLRMTQPLLWGEEEKLLWNVVDVYELSVRETVRGGASGLAAGHVDQCPGDV
jgi:hypothetical protein